MKRTRLRLALSLGTALGLTAGPLTAHAVTTVPLGIADGVVGIHYNNNGNGEVPANQAYIRAQFSDVNTNGALFNFDATVLPGTFGTTSFRSIFQSVQDQFGLDLILKAPTSDGSVTIPTLTAYENVDGTPANATPVAGAVTWAINGYQIPTVGPGDPANGIVNSLLRGGTGANFGNNGVTLTVNTVTEGPPGVFTAGIEGELQSDGVVHWYNPATPNTPLPALELTGKFFFSGTLTYSSSSDPYPLIDFYEGPVAIEAEVICGTRYVDAQNGSDHLGNGFNFCRNALTPCQTLQRTIDLACPGDTIEIEGANVNATRLDFKKSTKTPPNGTAKVKGTFLLQQPGDVFSAAQGISLQLADNNLNSVSYTFPAAECVTSNTKVSCRSADKNVKAKFQTSPAAPGLWRFSATFKKQNVGGPFLGPTQVHLIYGAGIERPGVVSDCVTSFQKIRCREF